MKKLLIFIGIIILIVFFSCIYSMFNSKEKKECLGRFEEFQEACQSGRIDAVVQYIQIDTNLVPEAGDIVIQIFLNYIPDSLVENINSNENIKKILSLFSKESTKVEEYSIRKCPFQNYSARLKCIQTYEKNGSKFLRKIKITMIKDDKWYIKSIEQYGEEKIK